MSHSHRVLVRGLESFPSIKIGDQEYSGPYFAGLCSINTAHLGEAATITPQLIAEIGRTVAAAYREKAILELQYRVWREGKILGVVTDPDEALKAGLTDGDKPAAKGVAESWIHTLPEYTVWNEKIAHVEEAWSTVSHALEAAKARKQAFIDFSQSGAQGGESSNNGTSYSGGLGDGDNEADLAAAASNSPVSPLPTSVPVSNGPPSFPSGPPGPPPIPRH